MPVWMTCAAVVPCLNEERSIAALVREVRSHVGHVYVVDDGSHDGTTEAADAGGATVLRHETTQGKGAALRTGFLAASRSGFTHAVILDGDGQHAPNDIPKFKECALQTASALVVGNRMHDTRRMPLVRRLVNWWMSRRLSEFAGQHLPDTQCGFRLMSLAAWSGLSLKARKFEVESEVLLSFARAGHRIEFVPIQVIYGEERSKISPLKDAWRWFRWLREQKGHE